MVPQSASLWRLFFIDVWRRVRSQMSGKKLFPSTKKMINKFSKTAARSCYFLCGKICEKLIFNKMFKFFIEKDLISANQSGFKSGDCWVNQFLSISHDIYKSFDCSYEVGGAFLDISKHLTKFGTLVSYLNWNKITYLENHTNFYMMS